MPRAARGPNLVEHPAFSKEGGKRFIIKPVKQEDVNDDKCRKLPATTCGLGGVISIRLVCRPFMPFNIFYVGVVKYSIRYQTTPCKC